MADERPPIEQLLDRVIVRADRGAGRATATSSEAGRPGAAEVDLATHVRPVRSPARPPRARQAARPARPAAAPASRRPRPSATRAVRTAVPVTRSTRLPAAEGDRRPTKRPGRGRQYAAGRRTAGSCRRRRHRRCPSPTTTAWRPRRSSPGSERFDAAELAADPALRVGRPVPAHGPGQDRPTPRPSRDRGGPPGRRRGRHRCSPHSRSTPARAPGRSARGRRTARRGRARGRRRVLDRPPRRPAQWIVLSPTIDDVSGRRLAGRLVGRSTRDRSGLGRARAHASSDSATACCSTALAERAQARGAIGRRSRRAAGRPGDEEPVRAIRDEGAQARSSADGDRRRLTRDAPSFSGPSSAACASR